MTTSAATTRRTVGILIYDGVEVLDFAGPFEVFASVAITDEMDQTALLFEVVTIAPEQRLITCAGGLLVQPHYSLENHPPLDILVVPGGDVREVSRNRRVLDWIIREDRQAEVLASVCTGAFLLAESGLLEGGPATTHWAGIGHMAKQYPEIEVVSDQRIVDRGHLVTSAGVSAGIDMALHLVARLHGTETAVDTARGMEYEWNADTVTEGGEQLQRETEDTGCLFNRPWARPRRPRS
jgi:transcriptional regulator GlxA family with amidase domain